MMLGPESFIQSGPDTSMVCSEDMPLSWLGERDFFIDTLLVRIYDSIVNLLHHRDDSGDRPRAMGV